MRAFACYAGLWACCLGLAAQAQTGGFDAAAIVDATARAAAEEALKKSAAVNEFYCTTESKTPLEGGKMVWNKCQFAFRRPNLAFEQLAVQQNPIPGMTGQQQWTSCDGKTIWQYTQNAPGSELEYVQRLQGIAPEKLQQIAQKHRTPTAEKFDLARLEEGQFKIGDLISTMVIIDIWSRLQPATITLESQTAEVWVFAGKLVKPTVAVSSIRFSVSKGDGLARQIELAGMVKTTITVAGLQANPQPKVEDRYFQSQIPAGVEADDKTDRMLAINP